MIGLPSAQQMVDDGEHTVAGGNHGPLGANAADEAMVLDRQVESIFGVGMTQATSESTAHKCRLPLVVEAF